MTPDETLVDAFVGGFRERIHATRQSGQELIEAPGLLALLGRSQILLDGRVLVTDDRALDLLRTCRGELCARVVNVFARAERCSRMFSDDDSYRPEPATAMVSLDLRAIPAPPLPEGLTLHRVSPDPSTSGVSLEEAAEAALRSDPASAPAADLAGFVTYLRSAPRARYLVATDGAGVVRATAAAGVFGRTTGVFFVNTDPAWRGQGVGTAMTAAALKVASSAGADTAFLDASGLGRSIYLRLGFHPVCDNTLFVRVD